MLDNEVRIGWRSVGLSSFMNVDLELAKGSELIKKETIVVRGKTEANMVLVSDYEDALALMYKDLAESVLLFVRNNLSTLAQSSRNESIKPVKFDQGAIDKGLGNPPK